MLRDEIWALIHSSPVGMFCIGCAEERLGRRLVRSDFNDSFVNNPKLHRMSDRLRDRLKADWEEV